MLGLLPIMRDIELSKSVGKDLATSKIEEAKKNCCDIRTEVRARSPSKLAHIYSTIQDYKLTLQPRTAFIDKTPAQERVTINATSIPRPSEKRLDTSEAPNTEK